MREISTCPDTYLANVGATLENVVGPTLENQRSYLGKYYIAAIKHLHDVANYLDNFFKRCVVAECLQSADCVSQERRRHDLGKTTIVLDQSCILINNYNNRVLLLTPILRSSSHYTVHIIHNL